MLKVTVKNKINFPEFTFQEELEHIAKNIIIPDIIRGIDTSMAILGGYLPPNEAETIKRKGHGRQLVETGQLRSSFYHKLLSKSKVLVSIQGDRKKIGGYLQDGIMAKGSLKQYIFFGISKDAYDSAMSFMKKTIKEKTSGAKR